MTAPDVSFPISSNEDLEIEGETVSPRAKTVGTVRIRQREMGA
jgi:hypothetical protein